MITDRIPKIWPITATQIHWSVLQSVTQQALGRSITASLDKHNVALNNYAAFVGALGEFQREKTQPEIIYNEEIFKHLDVGFVGLCYKLDFADMCFFGLNVTYTSTPKDTHTCFIVSGNLSQWRDSILRVLCSLEPNPYAVMAHNQFYEAINKLDHLLFRAWRKRYDILPGFEQFFILDEG